MESRSQLHLRIHGSWYLVWPLQWPFWQRPPFWFNTIPAKQEHPIHRSSILFRFVAGLTSIDDQTPPNGGVSEAEFDRLACYIKTILAIIESCVMGIRKSRDPTDKQPYSNKIQGIV